MINTKNKAILSILMMVVLFFAILMLFAFYTLNIFKDSGNTATEGEGPIAVIEVQGVIMDSQKTIELLQMAEEDPSTKAIIVRIDSPGGAVGPTQEIYEEIVRIDTKIPVYASFGTVAASGGHYIGSAARKIWANPGSITGSIGVIMQFLDLSKLYELAKVNQLNIKAGRYKDLGHPNRSMTEEERSLLERMLKEVHQQFINDIVKRREGRIKGDINEIAQGQIFSGQEAKALGLVDELGGLWTAGRMIFTELKLKGKFGLRFVKRKKKTGLMDLVEGLDEASARLATILNQGETPRLMAQ